MRTKQCRKLLDVDPICDRVLPVRLSFDRSSSFLKSEIEVSGYPLRILHDQNEFAHKDGFETIHEMADFWFSTHGFSGQKVIVFRGVVIEWNPDERV